MSVDLAHEEALVAAGREGGEAAFASLADRYRPELQLHCYRMMGSLQDAEDLVQETFLRAWRHRAGFEGRSSFRAWLYRIATNACLDALGRRSRRLLPPEVAPAADPDVAVRPPLDLPWLEPYPDRLLDALPAEGADPVPVVVAKETIELAFLAAIQHLPPRQRAVLVLRDALDWSARDTAALLDGTVASVNSALQRARRTLRKHLPARRSEWGAFAARDAAEQALLERYVDAWHRADVAGLVELLREDVRMTMPPTPSWYDGRDAVLGFVSRHVFAARPRRLERLVPTRANRQPAFGIYARSEGDPEYRPLALKVLRIEDGVVAEISGFVTPELFASFGLPDALPATA